MLLSGSENNVTFVYDGSVGRGSYVTLGFYFSKFFQYYLLHLLKVKPS